MSKRYFYLIVATLGATLSGWYFPHNYIEAFRIYVLVPVFFVSIVVSVFFQVLIHWAHLRPLIYQIFIAEMDAERKHQEAVRKFVQDKGKSVSREPSIRLDTETEKHGA